MNQPTMDEPRTVDTDNSPALPAIPTAMTPVDPPPGSDRPRRSGAGRAFATGLAVVVLGFGGGVGGFYAADQWSGDDDASQSASAPVQPSNSSSSATTRVDDDESSDETPRSIYSRVAPAVVHIDARIVEEQSFFGIPQGEQESSGTGSGFIIDDEGHVVTNAHVVEDAKTLRVNFGEEASVPAKVVGIDKSSDIAVLKIDPDVEGLKGGITTVDFGDSGQLQVGDAVLAIGNPFGLDRTLTTGVVSALQRDIPALNDFRISDVIQTDAAVNPGNSGGPLLNMQGQVIGVNSQIQSRGGGFDGVAFAVPSATVQKVAETLIKDGSVDYAWLGVQGGQLTDELRTELKLDDDVDGVLVSAVTDGSPADRAGLRGAPNRNVPGGDVILSFDGTKLDSMVQLSDLVDSKQPKDEVKVVVLRDGKQQTLEVRLANRPDSVETED